MVFKYRPRPGCRLEEWQIQGTKCEDDLKKKLMQRVLYSVKKIRKYKHTIKKTKIDHSLDFKSLL